MNSTVSGNSASVCGGVCGGTVEIGNTILDANASGNIDGTVISDGYNICSDDGGGLLNGPGDQINTDPLLGPLQDNGGPTLTHLPWPGSPAIDAGDPSFIPPPLRDQNRGVLVRHHDQLRSSEKFGTVIPIQPFSPKAASGRRTSKRAACAKKFSPFQLR